MLKTSYNVLTGSPTIFCLFVGQMNYIYKISLTRSEQKMTENPNPLLYIYIYIYIYHNKAGLRVDGRPYLFRK